MADRSDSSWWARIWTRFQIALNRAKFARRRSDVSRRQFTLQGIIAMLAGLVVAKLSFRDDVAYAETDAIPIRPPTASLDDELFRKKCISCGLCGTVCENGCIRFYGLDEPRFGRMTPYLDVRRRSCTLCMRCTQICPTGALREVPDDLDVIAEEVEMGVAVVDRSVACRIWDVSAATAMTLARFPISPFV